MYCSSATTQCMQGIFSDEGACCDHQLLWVLGDCFIQGCTDGQGLTLLSYFFLKVMVINLPVRALAACNINLIFLLFNVS